MIIMVMMIWGWVQFWHSFHCMHCFPYHLTSQHNMSIILNHLQVYCPVRSAPGDALDTATIWLAIILPTVGGPALSFILCVSWITQDIVTCVRDAPPPSPDQIVQFFFIFQTTIEPPRPPSYILNSYVAIFFDPETAASRHFLLTKIFLNNTKFATFFFKRVWPCRPPPLNNIDKTPPQGADPAVHVRLAVQANVRLVPSSPTPHCPPPCHVCHHIFDIYIPDAIYLLLNLIYQIGTPPTSCLPNAPTSLSSTTWWSSTGSARASSSSCRSPWSPASRTCARGWSRRSAAPCFVPCRSSAEGVLGQRWSLQTKKRQNKCADEKNSHMYWHLWRKQ